MGDPNTAMVLVSQVFRVAFPKDLGKNCHDIPRGFIEVETSTRWAPSSKWLSLVFKTVLRTLEPSNQPFFKRMEMIESWMKLVISNHFPSVKIWFIIGRKQPFINFYNSCLLGTLLTHMFLESSLQPKMC